MSIRDSKTFITFTYLHVYFFSSIPSPFVIALLTISDSSHFIHSMADLVMTNWILHINMPKTQRSPQRPRLGQRRRCNDWKQVTESQIQIKNANGIERKEQWLQRALASVEVIRTVTLITAKQMRCLGFCHRTMQLWWWKPVSPLSMLKQALIPHVLMVNSFQSMSSYWLRYKLRRRNLT